MPTNISDPINLLELYSNINPYSKVHGIESHFKGNVPKIFHMPTYDEYNIPDNIFDIFLQRSIKFNLLETILKWFFFISGYCLIVYLCIKHLGADTDLLLLLGCLLPYALCAGFINELFSTSFYCFLRKFEKNTELHKRYEIYLDAVKAFEYWQTVNTLDYWMNLNGHQFEEAVASAFRRIGYSAKVSKQGGDGGIDIVLKKDSECIAVQCKAHKTPIGPSVVRDLYGTMQHFGYKQGMLVSRSGFTGGTIDFSLGKNIQLVSLTQLLTITKAE